MDYFILRAVADDRRRELLAQAERVRALKTPRGAQKSSFRGRVADVAQELSDRFAGLAHALRDETIA